MSRKTKYRPPGLLRPGVNPDVKMMLCTAGHVDHGKTALVKLLTGCQTDRLKVEQERGLTIELGFAPCFLGGDLCVGVVDVPGHEKFVKNMVAGVSGIGMTLLVIAADDGIMPQTIEHFQIMDLLGVQGGMIALTKIDLVSPERVTEVSGEIREFFKDTFLANVPLCPVSSETLEGYFELYEALVAQIDSISAQQPDGIFRMPVERAFTRPGYGAVVSGVPIDGSLAIGDQIELVPGGRRGKVRGIQRFLRDAEQGQRGQCLALNIPDFSKPPPERGQVICHPGYLNPCRLLHVNLQTVPGLEQPVRNAEEIKFHTGASETPGKLHLLESQALGENSRGLATVVLARPIAAAWGDRFIIRRASPAITIAGGEILDVSPATKRPRKAPLLERLQSFLSFWAEIEERARSEGKELDRAHAKVEFFLRLGQPTGGSSKAIARGALLPKKTAEACLQLLVQEQQALQLQEDYFIWADAYHRLHRQTVKRLEQLTAAKSDLTCTIGELFQNKEWPPLLRRRILTDLEQAGLLTVKGEKLIPRAAADDFDRAEGQLLKKLIELYAATGFHSPRPDELPQKLGASPEKIKRLLEHLTNQGRLVWVTKNVILSRGHFMEAQNMVVRTIQEKGGLDSADFKTYIGSSRKYALAILDFLDARGITSRTDNLRRLTVDYQKKLL